MIDNARNTTSNATSDEAGRFRVTNLNPGSYQVRINAPGFVDYKANVVVEVGLVTSLEIQLHQTVIIIRILRIQKLGLLEGLRRFVDPAELVVAVGHAVVGVGIPRITLEVFFEPGGGG